MKNVFKILALLAIVSITGTAIAADAAKPENKPGKGLKGRVVKVDGTKITIKIKGGEEKVIDTDDSTKFTLDGKTATISDVKPDERITANPETGVATEVTLVTKGKKADKGAATPAPAAGDAK